MKISERIKTIAKHVPKGSVVADIGTDHGYLLKILLDQNKIKKGIGCDVNKNPLSYAKKNLSQYIENHRAQLILGDGLEPLAEKNVDCIVIAGMGGLLMIDILKNKQQVTDHVEKIILSPNLAWEKIRKYVTENGWKIADEDLVFEDGKFYPIIVLEKGLDKDYSECELFFGPLLISHKHALLSQLVDHEKQKTEDIINKIKESGHKNSEELIEKERYKWKKKSRCIYGTTCN